MFKNWWIVNLKCSVSNSNEDMKLKKHPLGGAFFICNDMAESYKKQSAGSRTSKASAVDHILKLKGEYGEAIKAKVEKIAGSGKATEPSIQRITSNTVTSDVSVKSELSDADITTKLETKSKFTDTQLENMNKTQLYHTLRTLAMNTDVKLESDADILDTVIAMKDSEDVAGMKDLVKELQGDVSNDNVLRDDGEGGRIEADKIDKITRESINTKLTTYLLDFNHSSGHSKAKWFKEALGFTQDNSVELAKQIVFDPQKVIVKTENIYGIKYSQFIAIKGLNGRTIAVQFVWIKNKDGIIRLVTAIPTKK